MNLQNQIAIITGGASGMGAATARALFNEGAKVVLFDTNLKLANEIASECKGIAIECDVTNEQSAKAAFEKVKSESGTATICVNCAGIAPAAKIIGKEGAASLNDFQRAININLVGTFNIMRLAAESMSKINSLNEDGERGVIINTASIAAFDGQIGQAAYSASKGGIVSMTLPAARELAKYGIRVMAIAPGLIDTPMLATLSNEIRDNLASDIPFPKRFGKPEEFAHLVIEIITNPLLNGSVIRLDAALRMRAK